MNELSELLIKLRGSESGRKAAKRAGISHNYLAILEKGIDPTTKAPVSPSPETLRSLANAYNYPHEDLMKLAGHLDRDSYVEETKKTYTLETIDQAIFDEFMKMDWKKKDKLRRIMEIVKEE